MWCETDAGALAANIRTFRRVVGPSVRLAPVVKANAYGHGLSIAARAFASAGADWLCVHSLAEGRAVRAAGLTLPVMVLGPVLLDELAEAVALDLRLVVYNHETVARLAALNLPARLHLKIETGNHRQGLEPDAALALAAQIAGTPGLVLEGVSSHFANIEDTTDHSYARHQLARFEATVARLRAAGHPVPIRHLANSAATLLWPDQAFEMVRVGLAAYGLWPSGETQVAATLAGRHVELVPALTWKTRVAQIKAVPEGAYVGYGCSYMTTYPTRLAILPVGYAEGYDRQLGNLAHVLVGGRRAPVRGRVCMNITMVDVTHTPAAALEDEVVLMGRQGQDAITAEQLAAWAGTINYEVVARISPDVPRVEQSPEARPVTRSPYRPPKAPSGV